MFSLVTTSHFDRRITKFQRAHPDLRRRLATVLRDMETDPFQGHLRLHRLKGRLEGLHAISITRTYRITFILKVPERELILLDVGSHDEVYD